MGVLSIPSSNSNVVLTSKADELSASSSALLSLSRVASWRRHLCDTVRLLQKHRGSSLACLDGDPRFEQVTSALTSQIEGFLQCLHAELATLDADAGALALWRRSDQDWCCLRDGWTQDDALHSFELHSHLIGDLLKLLKWPLGPLPGEAEVDALLLDELPVAIENLAALRGLSVHALLQPEDTTLQSRLAFQVKSVMQEYRALCRSIHRFSEESIEVTSLRHIILLEERLKSVLEQVPCSADVPATDAQWLFRAFTEIIERYWDGLDAGLCAMERRDKRRLFK